MTSVEPAQAPSSASPLAHPGATGVGSWPGLSVREAVRAVRDLLAEQVPYLPETPARGPGADLIGRTAARLVDLHVDLQPIGWRFVDRPGRDAGRAAALWREDLDELAEAYDGYVGPLKVQVAGPYTLAAATWLTRGERSVVDPGARRDICDSLAAGLSAHLVDLERLVPGARLILQVDEPSISAVLAGELPTSSGFGRLPAVDRVEVRDGLRTVLAAAGSRPTVIHSCAANPPVAVLRESGAGGLSVDTVMLSDRGWEGLALARESGQALYVGALPSSGAAAQPQDVARRLVDRWGDLGLDHSLLDGVLVTPTCGLAGATPAEARAITRACVQTALEIRELTGC